MMQLEGPLSIGQACDLTRVSRAGFYRHYDEHEPRQADMVLRDAIQRIVLDNRFYGGRTGDGVLFLAPWTPTPLTELTPLTGPARAGPIEVSSRLQLRWKRRGQTTRAGASARARIRLRASSTLSQTLHIMAPRILPSRR